MRTLVILASLIPMMGSGQISMNVDILYNWNDTTIPDNGSGATYNETWGFVQDGIEYGVIGSTLGTHFFQLTANDELVLVDYVPGRFQGAVVHRDYHDHDGYLYAICQQGGSSLQIMDLQYLPDSVSVVYDSDTLFSIAHNVYIDTATSKLYVDSPPALAMTVYDISDPVDPELISIFTEVSSVHDCFVRNDTAYLNCGTDGLFVYDFSTGGFTPQIIGSLTSYPDQGYNHSGWLSEDGETYVMADETNGMRMKVCDVSDLNDITPLGLFNSGVDTNTVPHNLMLKEDLVYVSHYNDGLRIFDISDPLNPAMVGYYDTYPAIDTASAFRGAWGIYSFFPSGRLLISDRQTGLYLFRYNDPTAGMGEEPNESGFSIFPNPNEGAFTLNVTRQIAGQRFTLVSTSGQVVLEAGPLSAGMHQIHAEGLAPGIYVARFGTGSQRLVVR